ncbi:hypothetical protein V8G54_005915 [Vigna mungo]|uniref:Uncharacterized protein n=1 Tax=Vigna mungo TaxID=3915 RepID=A0AAQ3P2B8_VIGMU
MSPYCHIPRLLLFASSWKFSKLSMADCRSFLSHLFLFSVLANPSCSMAALTLISASTATRVTARIVPVPCSLTFPPEVSFSSTLALNSFPLFKVSSLKYSAASCPKSSSKFGILM